MNSDDSNLAAGLFTARIGESVRDNSGENPWLRPWTIPVDNFPALEWLISLPAAADNQFVLVTALLLNVLS
ncbi:hypothetical protein [Dyella japonica]|uniref:hypothetical protein n=1 Tax=Dyella japonica TaxID=231455 RepID=UPI0012E06BC9|nr:hypothetical protein [Dyella japonica]